MFEWKVISDSNCLIKNIFKRNLIFKNFNKNSFRNYSTTGMLKGLSNKYYFIPVWCLPQKNLEQEIETRLIQFTITLKNLTLAKLHFSKKKEEEEEVETKSERVIPETSCPMECQLCSYSPFPLASVAISLAVRFLPWKSAHLLHRYN